MSALTSDLYRCLDCGHDSLAVLRWIADSSPLLCPACSSPALHRRRTFWRTLRDAVIVTNAA